MASLCESPVEITAASRVLTRGQEYREKTGEATKTTRGRKKQAKKSNKDGQDEEKLEKERKRSDESTANSQKSASQCSKSSAKRKREQSQNEPVKARKIDDTETRKGEDLIQQEEVDLNEEIEEERNEQGGRDDTGNDISNEVFGNEDNSEIRDREEDEYWDEFEGHTRAPQFLKQSNGMALKDIIDEDMSDEDRRNLDKDMDQEIIIQTPAEMWMTDEVIYVQNQIRIKAEYVLLTEGEKTTYMKLGDFIDEKRGKLEQELTDKGYGIDLEKAKELLTTQIEQEREKWMRVAEKEKSEGRKTSKKLSWVEQQLTEMQENYVVAMKEIKELKNLQKYQEKKDRSISSQDPEEQDEEGEHEEEEQETEGDTESKDESKRGGKKFTKVVYKKNKKLQQKIRKVREEKEAVENQAFTAMN